MELREQHDRLVATEAEVVALKARVRRALSCVAFPCPVVMPLSCSVLAGESRYTTCGTDWFLSGEVAYDAFM